MPECFCWSERSKRNHHVIVDRDILVLEGKPPEAMAHLVNHFTIFRI